MELYIPIIWTKLIETNYLFILIFTKELSKCVRGVMAWLIFGVLFKVTSYSYFAFYTFLSVYIFSIFLLRQNVFLFIVIVLFWVCENPCYKNVVFI